MTRFSCPNCGSTEGVSGAVLQGCGPDARPLHLQVGKRDPAAIVFNQPAEIPILADVCARCGHLEMRVRALGLVREFLRPAPLPGK